MKEKTKYILSLILRVIEFILRHLVNSKKENDNKESNP